MLILENKTNIYALMIVDKYISEMEQALLKRSRPINIKNIRKYQNDALILLEELRLSLSFKEYQGYYNKLTPAKYQLSNYF